MPSVPIPFRLVDVFTPRPLAGNQLCVVPEPAGIDETTMQAIAKEIGFSETTFVTSSGGDRYAMRIFTPGKELPFAGHPTLGTAFVMVSEGRVTTPAIQSVAAGEIPVEVDAASNWAWMRQLPPVFGPEFADRELIARAIGLTAEDLHPDLPIRTVSTGLPPLIVPVRDAQALGRARNAEAVGEAAAAAGAEELYLFALTDDGVTARMFESGFGAGGEDPATGSAAGPARRVPGRIRPRGDARDRADPPGCAGGPPERAPRRGRAARGTGGACGSAAAFASSGEASSTCRRKGTSSTQREGAP